jgi:trehalose utilization protein
VTFVRMESGEAMHVSTPLNRFVERWQQGLRTGHFVKAYRSGDGRAVLFNPRRIIYVNNHDERP